MTTSKSRVIQGRESRRRESVMTNDPRRHSQTIPAKKLKNSIYSPMHKRTVSGGPIGK